MWKRFSILLVNNKCCSRSANQFFTHAKCMKSGRSSKPWPLLPLATLLLLETSFILRISFSHWSTSRPSFLSKTLAVAIRASKFSWPWT